MLFQNYTELAKQTVFFAKGEAVELGDDELRPEHILLGLLKDRVVTAQILGGISVSQIRQNIQAHATVRQHFDASRDLRISDKALDVFTRAEKAAHEHGAAQVTNLHILVALLDSGEGFVHQLLHSTGITADAVRSLIATIRRNEAEEYGRERKQPFVEYEPSAASSRQIAQTIQQVRELSAQGKVTEALNLLDYVIFEDPAESSIRIRHLAPLATAAARSLKDFDLVKRYCELRVANDPNDAVALYGIAESLFKSGKTEEAQSYIAKCRRLSATMDNATRQDFLALLQENFPEGS